MSTDQPAQPDPDVDNGDTLQGAQPLLDVPQKRQDAIEQAFDYRGDVTIHTADGRVIQGYVFDRCHEGSQPYLRMIPADGAERMSVAYGDISQLVFSGRDTAAGKSWETWVKKYHEKRARDEPANLEPDPLD